ncbi:MAG: sigma-70 family RNA polymerase sigma factor [Hyphomicrobiales bacterium]|nr:sigma-70 family RNA polymerase sigma factor [Hyphomicrobiales bacterium]
MAEPESVPVQDCASDEDDDETLVLAVAKGSEAAFARLVSRHSASVYALARRFTGNDGDTDDLTQEIFWKLWTRAAHWRPGEARFSTWLYRVAVNHCIDWDRKRRWRRWLPLAEVAEVADDGVAVDRQLEAQQALAEIRSAILKLPAKQRAALLLSVQQEKSNRDIAEIMQTSEGAVEQLLVRARRTLRGTGSP